MTAQHPTQATTLTIHPKLITSKEARQQQKHLTSERILKCTHLRISKIMAHAVFLSLDNVIAQKAEAALVTHLHRIGLNILHAPQKLFLSK